MLKLYLFAGLSLIFIFVSYKSLLKMNSHGFFRFFAWECMLGLILLNAEHWFINPCSLLQIISWMLLSISIILVWKGARLLLLKGNIDHRRKGEELYSMEKTTTLVTDGLYGYIRHPLYASLLFLAWGAFLKHISMTTCLLVTGATLFLILTAKREEVENKSYFGPQYEQYMQKTNMFIPLPKSLKIHP